jgi:hypothetical protein
MPRLIEIKGMKTVFLLRYCICWIAMDLFLIGSAASAPVGDHKLDLEGPLRVLELPRRMPLPDRVDIYITGPRVYIDQTDTPNRLARNSPALSITNAMEIDTLMSLLQKSDNKARITNATTRMGYTYHLLLYYDPSKTLMHFRVFEPTESVTLWRVVDPRNNTGFGYFNDKIGSWLNARVKLPTNSLPAKPTATPRR